MALSDSPEADAQSPEVPSVDASQVSQIKLDQEECVLRLQDSLLQAIAKQHDALVARIDYNLSEALETMSDLMREAKQPLSSPPTSKRQSVSSSRQGLMRKGERASLFSLGSILSADSEENFGATVSDASRPSISLVSPQPLSGRSVSDTSSRGSSASCLSRTGAACASSQPLSTRSVTAPSSSSQTSSFSSALLSSLAQGPLTGAEDNVFYESGSSGRGLHAAPAVSNARCNLPAVPPSSSSSCSSVEALIGKQLSEPPSPTGPDQKNRQRGEQSSDSVCFHTPEGASGNAPVPVSSSSSNSSNKVSFDRQATKGVEADATKMTVAQVSTALEDELLASFTPWPKRSSMISMNSSYASSSRGSNMSAMPNMPSRFSTASISSKLQQITRKVTMSLDRSSSGVSDDGCSLSTSARGSVASAFGGSTRGSVTYSRRGTNKSLAEFFDQNPLHPSANVQNVVRIQTDSAMAWGFNDPVSAKDHSRLDDHFHHVEQASAKALVLLRVCGLLPWRAQLSRSLLDLSYQIFMAALAAFSTVATINTVVRMQDELAADRLCFSAACLQSENALADIVLSFGSFVGVSLAIWFTDSTEDSLHLLVSYAVSMSFGDRYIYLAKQQLAITLVLWIVVVVARVLVASEFLRSTSTWNILHFLSFAVSSLIIFAISFVVLFSCRGMMCAVDSYCVHVVAAGNLVDGAPRWNSVQAILRKSAAALHSVLCVLQVTSFLVFMISCVYVYQNAVDYSVDVYPLLPAVLLLVGILRILFTAAEVTERCGRIPSLVNASLFGPDTNVERHYLVQYISSSAAGFYMFQVRITSQMTMKFAHFCAVAMFAFMTQILN